MTIKENTTNMKEDYFVETVPYVHVGNGEWIATDKVEFIDISEDFQGYESYDLCV